MTVPENVHCGVAGTFALGVSTDVVINHTSVLESVRRADAARDNGAVAFSLLARDHRASRGQVNHSGSQTY